MAVGQARPEKEKLKISMREGGGRRRPRPRWRDLLDRQEVQPMTRRRDSR
jgi:hypothetical protein